MLVLILKLLEIILKYKKNYKYTINNIDYLMMIFFSTFKYSDDWYKVSGYARFGKACFTQP